MNFSEIINIHRPVDYMSSIKTYFRFTMPKRTTHSKATMRDPKEHMNELYEEQSKEWCTSALPCFDYFAETDLSRPCRIKTGVQIDCSVPGITSVDEAKVTLHYDERRGRIVRDHTFDGTQWIEFVSPFDEALGFWKKSDVHKLGNYVAICGNTRNLDYWSINKANLGFNSSDSNKIIITCVYCNNSS